MVCELGSVDVGFFVDAETVDTTQFGIVKVNIANGEATIAAVEDSTKNVKEAMVAAEDATATVGDVVAVTEDNTAALTSEKLK